jgi:hypothetical protein
MLVLGDGVEHLQGDRRVSVIDDAVNGLRDRPS